MKKIIFFLLLTTSYLLLTTSVAFAQSANTGLNLTLSPSILDLSAKPGDTLKETFRIRNNTDTTLPLSLTVNKLDVDPKNGQIVPVSPKPNDTTISWLSFDKTEFSTNAKEWTTIPFTITIPKTAAFGYYFALRIGQSQTSGNQNGATTKLLGQIVLPILLTVASPNAKANLQLVGFTTSSYLNEYLPVTFTMTLKNTGNIHLKPAGNVFIQIGSSQQDQAVLDINPDGGTILPGQTRTFTTRWTDGFLVEKPLPDNPTQTQLVVNWDRLTHFRIGKYTASLLAVYDNGKRDVPIEATTTFWVLPWKVLIGGMIGLVIVVFLGRLWLGWYVKQQIKKYNKG